MANQRKRKYPLEPTTISKTAWFYQYRGGLIVVSEAHARTSREYLATTQTVIPWKLLRKAVINHMRAVR